MVLLPRGYICVPLPSVSFTFLRLSTGLIEKKLDGGTDAADASDASDVSNAGNASQQLHNSFNAPIIFP